MKRAWLLPFAFAACDTASGDLLVARAPAGCGASDVVHAGGDVVQLVDAAGDGATSAVTFSTGGEPRAALVTGAGWTTARMRTLGDSATANRPVLAALGNGAFAVAFSDFGRRNVWTVTLGVLSVATPDAPLDVSLVTCAGEECIGPRLVAHADGVGVAYRDTQAVAFAALDASRNVVGATVLDPMLPHPWTRRAIALPGRDLVLVDRLGHFELEWFAPTGSWTAAGPRLDVVAADVAASGEQAWIVTIENDAVVVHDLAAGAATFSGARALAGVAGPVHRLGAATIAGRLVVAWIEERASGGELRAVWADGDAAIAPPVTLARLPQAALPADDPEAGRPRIVPASDGEARVVFVDARSSSPDVLAAARLCPPR